MTPQLDELELADLIAESVKAACGPLVLRLRALERGALLAKGMDGAPGPMGPPGERGERGVEGPIGPIGPQGIGAIGPMGPIGERGPQGEKGHDGVGITDALMTKDGHLALTFSDGTTRSIGKVLGEDGLPGRDGKDVDVDDVIHKVLALVPRPANGIDGAPGERGVGIDRLECVGDRLLAHLTDGRTLDAGSLPVKEGPAGKDADPEVVVPLVLSRIVPPKDGKDGKDVDIAEVKALVTEAMAALPVPKDGKDADPDDVKALVTSAVTEAVAGLPVPKDGQDGKSVSVHDVMPLVKSAVSEAVAALPPAKDGKDGQSVDLDALEQTIAAKVTKAVDSIPKPRDGQSVTVADVEPLVKAEVEKAVSAIPKPRDVEIDPIMLNALTDRLSGLETKWAGLEPRSDVDLSAVFAESLRMELKALGAPLRMQKRVIRDMHGKVERVVEEQVVVT